MFSTKLQIIRNDKTTKIMENDSSKGMKNIVNVKIDSIRPSPFQPRKNFERSSLEELCNSIKQYGVLQPISVRKISENSYELIAGERRLKAAFMAGLIEIPSIIKEIDDDDSAVIAMIENLLREDLNYLEEAEGYNNLISEHGLTQEELAKKMGKSQSTIANKIRLLRLSPEAKKMLSENNLTERHARALLKLHDERLQLKVLKCICERGFNVKKTEELIDRVIDKYSIKLNENRNENRKFIKSIKDVRIFVNTIRQAVDIMKQSGINARAAQIDRGIYMEYIVRIPK